jgi:hypothetical protein
VETQQAGRTCSFAVAATAHIPGAKEGAEKSKKHVAAAKGALIVFA